MSMLRNVQRGSVMVAVMVAAVVGSETRDAAACGGEWYPALMEPEPDRRPVLIPLAEKALEEGRSVAAAGIVIRVIPHIKTLKPTSSKIVERAHRVLAKALTAHDGALPVDKEVPDYVQDTWLGETERARRQNLDYAVSSLSALSEAKPDDPGLETDLAQAMALLPELRSKALEKLERLAERDLITSPEAYALLAELRAEAGDQSGEKLALSRCRAMAKSADSCDMGRAETRS
jgi:hypothetical protein